MAVLKFRREGAEVDLIGMNEASETIIDKLAIHDKPGAMDQLMAIEGGQDNDNQHAHRIGGRLGLFRKRLPPRRLDRRPKRLEGEGLSRHGAPQGAEKQDLSGRSGWAHARGFLSSCRNWTPNAPGFRMSMAAPSLRMPRRSSGRTARSRSRPGCARATLSRR